MGIKERKHRQKTEMRQAILDAAMSLFIEEGYDAVTIRKISEKIEYSPSTIYIYFKDKDSIFFELHTIGFAELLKHQMEVQNITDPRERLIAHGRAYVQFAIEHPQYYDLMFIVRSPGNKIMDFKNWECGDRSYELLKKNVVECREAGYMQGQDADAISFALWSMMHGMVALYIRNRLILYDINESKPPCKAINKEIPVPDIFEQVLAITKNLIR